MSLKLIKGKIRGIDKTHKVTKAMEAVSAVKMRKSQERALKGRPYAVAALSVLKRVSRSVGDRTHVFVAERPVSKICMIVVTSDKGLAGSLNSSVLKQAENTIAKANLSKESIGIIAVGKKGYEHFNKRGYTMLGYVENLGDDVTSDELAATTAQAVELFKSSYDQVLVVYNQFKSTFEQEAVARQVLPLKADELEEVVRGILPVEGKYAAEADAPERSEIYTIEPNEEIVLETLFPYLIQIMLYHSLLEAKASEHSARMVSMKNASDKARDLSKELTLKLNKARQAQITREVSEIVGGIEAMA